jgi:DNA-binding transcriptional regulator YiaG
MPNVAQVLKQEMRRIAAKEVRASGLGPKVKALQQQIRELGKRLKALEARPTPAPVELPVGVRAGAAEAGLVRLKLTPAAIKKIRARLGLSQAKFAKRLGVSHGAVYQWEAGRMKPGSKAAASLHALGAQPAAVPTQPSAKRPKPRRKGRRFKATPAVLKRVRAKLGVTQAELASLLGVSHSAVAKWEAGRISPREETAAALQDLEGVGKREARRRLAAK